MLQHHQHDDLGWRFGFPPPQYCRGCRGGGSLHQHHLPALPRRLVEQARSSVLPVAAPAPAEMEQQLTLLLLLLVLLLLLLHQYSRGCHGGGPLH